MKPSRIIVGVLLAAVAWVVLVGVAVLFVEGSLWITGLLDVQHALGMDTQTTHNYAAVSGVLPMVVAALGFTGVLTGAWHHHNCHQPGCPRLGHPHPEHGWPACRKHWNETPAHAGTPEGENTHD